MSHVEEDLSNQFKNWDPMADDYRDSKFNTYSSGPGAELDKSMQPAEMAKQSANNIKKDPTLVFKFVPDTLTTEGLMNICSSYGKCLRGRKFGNNMHFIDFASINDMERVFTGLETNTYGFRVELCKGNNSDKLVSRSLVQKTPIVNLPNEQNFQNKIDYNRSYQVSSHNVPRPQFAKTPFVQKDDYENRHNNLQRNDPQRHFMIEDDAHELERLQYGKKTNEQKDGQLNYHTGRAYYTMPQNSKQLIEDKQKSTAGNFDGNQGIFSKPSESSEKAKINSCTHCGKNCDLVCPRCMSPFCGLECQQAEWTRHRHICGKPRSMWPAWAKELAKQKSSEQNPNIKESAETSTSNTPPKSSKKSALKALLPPSDSNVILTAISKTNVVFVRSTLYEDNLTFFNTVSTIQKIAKNQSQIQHTPERGDIVLVKFREDQYNRAMILNPDNFDEIKLIYIDYGNIDSKPLDELYNAPEEYWNLPRMAVPIILKNVPEFFMTEEVRKYMYSYLNKDMKIVYDSEDLENGINLTELYDSSSNESFNETIASFKANPTDVKKAPVVYRESLEYLPLPTGENIELLVIDSSILQTGFVSCTTQAYVSQIQKFQKDIQQYVKETDKKEMYTPRINELCLAKYDEDNLWYRGRCIEVVGDGHPTILFFDYGNLCIVSVENIRKYPEEFTFPVMTADCEILGLPENIDEELVTKLEEMLDPGTKLLCKSVQHIQEDNMYSIDLGDQLKSILDS